MRCQKKRVIDPQLHGRNLNHRMGFQKYLMQILHSSEKKGPFKGGFICNYFSFDERKGSEVKIHSRRWFFLSEFSLGICLFDVVRLPSESETRESQKNWRISKFCVACLKLQLIYEKQSLLLINLECRYWQKTVWHIQCWFF